ncbi:uncharacterized protein N7469_004222 [Penicillium citrinum]|uniref:Uncharacterized protein n=1 Tax=Penicillium citrinum TaxID=5077 RepID=A0A9W9P424_PENCI|nr:uncharacterized protein N7469_004222 [Penicillium citrinum]KAJ5235054.1 hypothetical protein N7469_004222 [Penicillium citrinum]
MSRDLSQDTNVSLGKEIMLSTSRFGIYANVDNICLHWVRLAGVVPFYQTSYDQPYHVDLLQDLPFHRL